MSGLAFRGWGHFHYVPGNRYPFEATALNERTMAFFAAGLVLNQIPQGDVLVRNRVVLSDRRVAALGPTHNRKEGADAGSR